MPSSQLQTAAGGGMLIGDIAESAALKYGSQPAIIFGGEVRSFAAQRDRCRRLAHALQDLGLPAGARVAMLSANRPEYAETYYGVPMAAMILTFLNYRLRPGELAGALAHSEASALIAEPEFLAGLRPLLSQLPELRHVIILGPGGSNPAGGGLSYEDLLAAASPEPPAGGASDQDPAWLIYTSGTTGGPKGVVLTHRNVLTALSSWLIEVSPRIGESQLLPFPMCHIAGVGVPGYCLRGCPVVLQRSFDPPEFLSAIERYRVTGIPLAPTMLAMLADDPAARGHDLSSVRLIQYGSAPMTAALLQRALTLFPAAEFSTGFGMTELGANMLWFDAPSHREAVDGKPGRLLSVGRPMTLARTRVVDDGLRDVAPGETGELVVQGDQVSRQYWRDPDGTAAAWAGGWFHTGDLARIDADGYYYVVDRKKDMIITGGENVYSREVEEVLASHPAVHTVAVAGLPDDTWGERVTAFVIAMPGQHADADQLRGYARERLAAFKVPAQVIFVADLPRNVAGKVLKRELRAAWGQGQPG